MSTEKSRNINIDSLKGFGIILVVIGHIIQFVYAPDNFDNNIVFRYIYSFHMPLFMFISGYLAYNIKREIDNNWIKRRFNALVIPFLIWIIIDFFINKFDTNIIVRDLTHPDNTYWFLIVLFYNCFVLYLSQLFPKKIRNILYIAFIVVLELIPITMCGFDLLKWHIIFYALGYFVSLYKEPILKHKKIICMISIIVFNILVLFWHRTNEPLFIDALSQSSFKPFSQIICITYKYSIPILGIISFYTLFSIINFKGKKNVLSFLGQYTMEIYILHFFFLQIIKTGFIYLDSCLSFIICIIIPILISQITKRNKTINSLLFGK